MNTRQLSLLLILGPPLALGAAESKRITLDEALRLAEASPMVRILDREVEHAQAEVRATGLWPNPEVLLSREEALGTVDRLETLSFPLPLTGRLSLEKSAARSGLVAAEVRSGFALVSIIRADVRESFLDLVAAQERSSSLRTGLSRLSELVEVLQAREKEGESSGFDRMRAQRERAEIEADLLESRGRETRPRARLAALLGLSSDGLVAEGHLEAGGVLPPFGEVKAVAASRGDVIALDAEVERAGYLAKAAGRRAIPEPSLTIGIKNTEVDGVSGTGGVAAISFSLPLFDRGQGSRAIARAEEALLRTRREALARQVMAQAESALAEAIARREAAGAYAAAGDPEELVGIARAAYEAGEMRILELLDAYRTALAVHLRTIDLRAEARRAEIELNRVLGTEIVR